MHLLYFNFLSISIFLFFLIFFGNKIAKKYKLLDYPDDRKIHLNPIPLLGGVYFYFSICFSVYLFQFPEHLNSIIIYSSVIFFMGLLDDFYDLQVPLRFIIMIFGTYLLIEKGLHISNLGNYFDYNYIYLGSFSFLFTILCVVGLVNSFNFLDGSDGMLLTQSISCFILLLIFSILSNIEIIDIYFFLSFLLIFSILLLFNLGVSKKNKFFLGDSGRMTIGFIISFVLIYYSQTKNIFIHQSLVIWVVALPIFDFFSIITRRFKDNKSPFSPDRRHIHHLLNKIFTNNIIVLVITFIFSFLLGLLGFYVLKYFGPTFGIFAFLLILLLYIFFTFKFEKKISV